MTSQNPLSSEQTDSGAGNSEGKEIMKKKFILNDNLKGWLYLLPAILFLGVFMVYPLIDVFIYSFEEGYNSASQTFFGVGTYNYSYVLHDPYFLQPKSLTQSR